MEKQLFDKLHGLLDEAKFDEARKLVDEAFKTTSLGGDGESLFFQAELFGFLIDIGCENQNEKDLLDAITFFETNEEQLLSCLKKSSYYYNLANAKHGLGRIFYHKNRKTHHINTIKEKFQEPIRLYWLALKSIGNKEKNLEMKILINLSNSLVNVSRLVEGLQFLDIVLRANSSFPQALISKGDNLHYLMQVTNCAVTVSLFTQIYFCYDQGIKTNALPSSILKRCIHHREQTLNKVQELGFNVNDIEMEIGESEKEFNTLSSFRKYCITNFLTLNEHGIYCNCVATEKDDLQIGVKHGIFTGDVVPKLELLLNRIKSEFALARWMYYQSLKAETLLENDAQFSELLDGEIINSKTEMQRTSFRLCYGILDKIALGICKLYNLKNKRIHFETFWDEPKRNQELNEIKNIHLNALYSLACDLNTETGELKQFKNWRNKLEHNLLVLKDISKNDIDIFKIFSDEEFVAVVDAEDFKDKTLHLMQLTRAAIFSYVYCVRLQTIRHKEEADPNKSFVVDFKES